MNCYSYDNQPRRQMGGTPYSPMPLPAGMPSTAPAPAPAIGTQLPTGLPAGPGLTPVPSAPATGVVGPAPQTVQEVFYTPGYLRTQIGKRMRVDFLVGQNTLTDRSGTLVGVGASYILLKQFASDEIVMADLYSIKFVTIFP